MFPGRQPSRPGRNLRVRGFGVPLRHLHTHELCAPTKAVVLFWFGADAADRFQMFSYISIAMFNGGRRSYA